MRSSLLLVLMILLAAAGCQDRRFINFGRDKNGREYGMLLKSVDQYAKKEGLSREEAIRQLRQQADAAAAQGQTCRVCTTATPPPANAAPSATSAAYRADRADRAYQVQPAAHLDDDTRANPLRR